MSQTQETLSEGRYLIDKAQFFAYLDKATETESTVEFVVVRLEQPKDEYDDQPVPDVKRLGCNVGDYWIRPRS